MLSNRITPVPWQLRELAARSHSLSLSRINKTQRFFFLSASHCFLGNRKPLSDSGYWI